MSASRSSVWLRTLLFDTLAEFRAASSVELPEGATAYEAQSDALYRLDKRAGETTAYDDLVGSSAMVVPGDQSNGRWFAEQISGSSPYYHGSYLGASVIVTMTGGNWNYLGSTAGTFATNAGDTTLFELNEATGQITYHGPPRLVRVSMQASLINGIGATPIDVHACISRDGDVDDGTTTDYAVKGEQAQSIINTLAMIEVERVMLLNPGTTLRLAFRNATNADDVTLSYYQATISPI